LCALAWPDRIAQRRDGGAGRFLLANGRGAVLARPDALGNSEFLVALEVEDVDREARIHVGTSVSRQSIETLFAARIRQMDLVHWDPAAGAVLARRQRRLDALLLEDRPLQDPESEAVAAAMLDGLRQLGMDALPWTDALRLWLARVRFVGALKIPGLEGWPDLSEHWLREHLLDWLGPYLGDCTRRSHLAQLDLRSVLGARLDRMQQRRLDELAPEQLVLPTGTAVAIDYLDPNAPCASMRMQEVFGLAATPAVGGGRVPITFKLLSPARRPLQITRDLASFWRNAYSEVRKDMRGQYPKHYWPENPLEAEPMKGTRRRPNPR
jgi:ATP-dependent helicase HrpB